MAKEIFVAMGRALGVGIATLINVLNPALVILGGGVAAAWDAFAPAMFDELPRRCYIHREIPVRIERAQLGNDAGLVGAAYLAIQPT
jgi:glucokinase